MDRPRLTRATIVMISQKPVTLRGTIFSMISDSLRRACLLLLAVCCLGLDARHFPPDISPLDEPRLARAGQHGVSAVFREIVTHVDALSRSNDAAGEKGSGSAAALPTDSVLLQAQASQPARAPVVPEGHFSSVASFHHARAPPLTA